MTQRLFTFPKKEDDEDNIYISANDSRITGLQILDELSERQLSDKRLRDDDKSKGSHNSS